METNTIGNKIAQARKKATISQAQLAERLFISPQAVGKWERGESIPDIITMNRLADILGIDLNYFSEKTITGSSEILVAETFDKRVADSRPGEENIALPRSVKERNWDMSRENLVEIDFSGLKNVQEKFGYSNMQRCLFVGSDLSGLLLKSNNIDSCDFTNSDVSKSQIQNSNLSKDIFKNCSLKETKFLRSNMEGCDFTDADLTGVEFSSCAFGSNTIKNVTWHRTTFIGSHIDNLVFDGNLENCFFENCAFTRVTFQDATLSNTFFKNNKKLKKVQFINCKVDRMTYAFLKNGKAELSGITMVEV